MEQGYYSYSPQIYTMSSHQHQQPALNAGIPLDESSIRDSYGSDSNETPDKRTGRRKIKIEYINDKSRRHITFSKRKAGIMKKAYELSTLTGTQVLLLVVSETGLVYTFTTPKLQPLVTKPEGKNLIQSCLNAPDSVSTPSSEQTFFNAPTSQRSDSSNPQLQNDQKDVKTLNQGAPFYDSIQPDGNQTFRTEYRQLGSGFQPPVGYPNYATNPVYPYSDQNYWSRAPKQYMKKF